MTTLKNTVLILLGIAGAILAVLMVFLVYLRATVQS